MMTQHYDLIVIGSGSGVQMPTALVAAVYFASNNRPILELKGDLLRAACD